MRLSDNKLISVLDDLIKQAETEKSHFYVAMVLKNAKREILNLREELSKNYKAIEMAMNFLQLR